MAPASGALSESVTLTNNSLNAAAATQSVSVAGTAIAPVLPNLYPYFANTPATMPLDGTIVFYIGVANSGTAAAISNATVTLALPQGLQVVAGSLGQFCSGTVSYSPASSTITMSGISLAANANCQNGFTFTASALGLQQVTATAAVGTTTGSNASTSITVTPAVVASTSTLVASPNPAVAGSSVSVTATVVDANNNPVSGATVNFSQTIVGGAASASAAFSNGGVATTNASGVASVTLTDTAAESLSLSAVVSGTGTGSLASARAPFVAPAYVVTVSSDPATGRASYLFARSTKNLSF